MRVYISGPMTGLKDYNHPAFYRAEAKLKALGFTPLNPASLFPGEAPGSRPYAEYFRASLQLLLTAEGYYRLRGWLRSDGATTEVRAARLLGLELVGDEDVDGVYYPLERLSGTP